MGRTTYVTATLLLVGAWFDGTTPAPGAGQPIAGPMAVCLELPVSALCAVLAVRGLTRRRGPRPGARPGRPARICPRLRRGVTAPCRAPYRYEYRAPYARYA
jgi:hypothetical protein